MTSSEKTKNLRFFKKRWVKICGGICGSVVLFFLLLPFGVKYYLSDWLEKNGADQVTIDSFWYNPFLSRITLKGLDVQKDGKSLLSDSKIELNFGLSSLLKKDIRLQHAEYQDLAIDLEQYDDGRWRIASFTTSGDKEAAAVEVSEEEVASAWAFRADTVTLSNCTVVLKMIDLDIRVDIEQAELSRFTTREGQPAGAFTFTGKVNQAPVQFQLDTLQVVPGLRIGGKVVVSDFDLAVLAPLLKDVLTPFAAIAGIDGKVMFRMSAAKGIEVDYDGEMSLLEPSIGNSVFATQSKHLSWKGRVQYSALTGEPMLVKTDGLLAAQDYGLQLPGVPLEMNESVIELNGQTKVTIDAGVAVENKGSLLVEGYEMTLPTMAITEEKLLWKGNVAYDSKYQGGGQFVDSEGTLELGKYLFEGKDESIPLVSGGGDISWKGKVIYGQQKAEEPVTVGLFGTLDGVDLQTTLVGTGMQLTQGAIELKTDSTIVLSDNLEIKGESSLDLNGFEIQDIAKDSSVLSLNNLSLAGLKGQGGQAIDVGTLVASGLLLSVPGNFPLSVDIPEIELDGLHTDDMVTFKADGLNVKMPVLTALHNNHELGRLDNLTVKEITVDRSAKVLAGLVQLDSLLLLPGQESSAEQTVLSLQSVQLSDLSWSTDKGFRGDTLSFEDLVTNVIRDKDGNLNIASRLAAMQLSDESSGENSSYKEAESTDDVSAGAPFKLREILVGGESSLFFEDNTLAVPYKTDIAISLLQIDDIDSTLPDQETKIIFNGELEKRAPLEVAGSISPFKEKTEMKMKIKLRNYPLSSLSPYTVQSVGTGLASGQLKIQTTFGLANDELDMKNTLTLKKLKTEMVSAELAAELDNELPISLDAALSILRDSKGNIELDIPLNGPVADLNVGISDILVTALSKAIVPAASGYLMYTLGPYGALAYVGTKVGEKMLQVTLPPVVFVQQKISITEEHATYLKRVATILQDRPETDLQICPTVASWEFMTEKELVAVEGDIVMVDEKRLSQLDRLGQDRAAAVKAHLTEKYAIDKGRLLICDTFVNKEKKAIPAVLLQL